MSHVSVRRSRNPSRQPPPVQYFDPTLVSEHEASTLWHRVVAAIDNAHRFKNTATTICVQHSPAEISALYDQRGRLRLFTIRLIKTNALVLRGNRDGLLPLCGDIDHGQ